MQHAPPPRVHVKKIAGSVVELLEVSAVPVKVGEVVRHVDGMAQPHQLAIALKDGLIGAGKGEQQQSRGKGEQQ